MKTKLYITDEGFGPLVRQSAVLKELKLLMPTLKVLIQSQRHIEDAKRIIPGMEYQNKFNNIIWHKTDKGTRLRQAKRNARRKREKEASLNRIFHKPFFNSYIHIHVIIR